MPSSAGSKVMAARTVSTTVTAAPMAMPLMMPTFRVSMPSSATTTVSPANTTARPEVLSALAVDSATPMPAFRWARCRLTMNRA
ncbi:UNVERIFIED_CONTAM: hypothetical protein RKD50_001143 [Streptomyces canus]